MGLPCSRWRWPPARAGNTSHSLCTDVRPFPTVCNPSRHPLSQGVHPRGYAACPRLKTAEWRVLSRRVDPWSQRQIASILAASESVVSQRHALSWSSLAFAVMLRSRSNVLPLIPGG